MLRGQCMLLSLSTNRYIGIDPVTGEPYGADWTGCRPDRKDGTVFTWTVIDSDGSVKRRKKCNLLIIARQEKNRILPSFFFFTSSMFILSSEVQFYVFEEEEPLLIRKNAFLLMM